MAGELKTISSSTTRRESGPDGARGFMLMEALFSLGLLTVGMLAMASVFLQGMHQVNAATGLPVAKQKAVEMVESVFMSRDTRTISWAQVRNVADGGVFVDGAQPVRVPGVDGLVNTGDDGAIEHFRLPGLDGLVGTADDRIIPLAGFSRTVEITDINLNLRQITVTIGYPLGTGTATFTLVTYMSSYA
ncbi:MAG: hypothetical protein ABGY72_22785 [bacterium]|jgi:hypothetical protein